MSNVLDTFVIVSNSDIKLVRYLIRSYIEYFKIAGNLHIIFYEKDRKAASTIESEFSNIKIHYINSINYNEYRYQMYLKLQCHKFTDSEWIMILDADNLLINSICLSDLNLQKPQWNYAPWDDVTSRWREDTAKIMNTNIEFNFMSCPPFILKRSILEQINKDFSIEKILNNNSQISEFVLYGAYAYANFHDSYTWVNSHENQNTVFKLINQIPPNYMDLDSSVNFKQVIDTDIDYKGVVFWSHWDEAESKMSNFLSDSLKYNNISYNHKLANDKIFLEINTDELIHSGLRGVKGIYNDDWVKSDLYLDVLSKKTGLIQLAFARASKNLRVVGQTLEHDNGEYIIKEESILYPDGLFSLDVPIFANKSNLVSISFRTSYDTSAVKNGRQLYANFQGCYFKDKHISDESKIILTKVPIELAKDRLRKAKNDVIFKDEFVREDAHQLVQKLNDLELELFEQINKSSKTIQNLKHQIKNFEIMEHQLECYKITFGDITTNGKIKSKNPLQFLNQISSRIYTIFRPRLGVLKQYNPCSLDNLKTIEPKKLNFYPLISLVTPSYNQGDYIEKAIKSVISQNYPKLEYFIQDNQSLDNTSKILKKYEAMITGYEQCKDSGQSNAINRAFSKCSGEIMGWLNSDDELLDGTLSFIADFFQDNPDVDVVYGNRIMINEKGDHIGRWVCPNHDNKTMHYADFIPQETMFWRKSLWEKVGSGLDESLSFAMDWDLILRFQKSGAKIKHVNRFLGLFRVHEEQKTMKNISDIGIKEMRALRKKYLPSNADISRFSIRKNTSKYVMMSVLFDIITRIRIKLGLEV